jgi:hypothetical protein
MESEMSHKLYKNDFGLTIAETFENENVIITRFFNGGLNVEFKPDCDKKIVKMYKLLIQPIKKGD